jgi:hypothetical protein
MKGDNEGGRSDIADAKRLQSNIEEDFKSYGLKCSVKSDSGQAVVSCP